MKLTVTIEVKAHPISRGSRDYVHVTGPGSAGRSGPTMMFPLRGRELATALKEELTGERWASVARDLLTAAVAQCEAASRFTTQELDHFHHAFIVALLWSSTDEDGNPLDDDRDHTDMDSASFAACRIVCDDFALSNAADIRAAMALQAGYTIEQAGHDFALTRNRHGAGFWDRGLGDIGKRLTEACRPYGEVDPYVGDDGLIYTN